MKKIIILLGICVLFAACNKTPQPKQVVEEFYKCYFNNDFDKIQDLVTPENRGYYEQIQKVIEMTNYSEKMDVEVKNIECEIMEDTIAVCTCEIVRTVSEEKEIEKGVLNLKKVDNRWLVNSGKEEAAFLGSENSLFEIDNNEPTINDSIVVEDEMANIE